MYTNTHAQRSYMRLLSLGCFCRSASVAIGVGGAHRCRIGGRVGASITFASLSLENLTGLCLLETADCLASLGAVVAHRCGVGHAHRLWRKEKKRESREEGYFRMRMSVATKQIGDGAMKDYLCTNNG